MRGGLADVLHLCVAVGILASVAFYVAGYWEARRFFGRRRRVNGRTGGEKTLPAVTLLKPLKGLDAELHSNLSTFCGQEYSTFQIVFGVADGADPAVQVVRRLQAEFPAVDIDLVIDSRVYGSNYKVSNLHNMYAAAQHDIILIADSDIRVPPDYLRRVVAEFEDPQVGLVTCLYRAVPTGGLPTVVEALCVNTDFVPMVMVARVVEKPSYAFGSTMAMPRVVLDDIGGFLPLANYLADDYQLGHRIAARGRRLALSDVVVETIMTTRTWRGLFEHQLRWARSQRICRPGGYFGSVVTHGTLWASVNLLSRHGSASAVTLAVLVYGLRMVTASAICNRYLHARLSFAQALLVPLKDLFASALWLLSFLGNTVQWGGQRFRVMRDGQMASVSPAAAGPRYEP